jgi:signal transduction histidine kinase
MSRETQIVIGPDGIVLAASGELAAGLLDARLEECVVLPREVRDMAKEILVQLRGSSNRVVARNVALDGGDRRVQLIAIEALAIRRTATDVRELLASKLAVLASQALEAEVTLSIVVAEDVPAVVHLDAEKLAWSVTTLVGNALRYVRSGSRRMPSRTIAVRAALDPGAAGITIEVQDDGPGIPTDTVTRLFKRDGLNVRGAGLALLLMSDISVAHGGKVEVRSSTAASDHGTTVRMMFPASTLTAATG